MAQPYFYAEMLTLTNMLFMASNVWHFMFLASHMLLLLYMYMNALYFTTHSCMLNLLDAYHESTYIILIFHAQIVSPSG